MGIKRLVIGIAVIMLLLFVACSDDESVYPKERAVASGTTDSSGKVELDLGSHIITVSVINEAEAGLSDIPVTGYLLNDYFFAFTGGNESYYPGFRFMPYDSMEIAEDISYSPHVSGVQSPESYQAFEAEVVITLASLDRQVYSYYNEPPHNEAVYTDEWCTPVSSLGTLEDVYNLTDSVTIDNGFFIHITSNVATLTNAEVQTVSVAMSQIEDFETFSVLMGLEFHIFNDDTLNIHYVTYNDSILPVIYINSVIMAEGSFFAQFTLTWDENPRDLDSHLWTPEIEGDSFHIYFASKGETLEPPYAFLDLDDITSWGPEHIVVYQGFPGLYTYAVHHWAGEGDIPSSNAEVSILKPDRSVQEFTPPDTTAQEDWYWHVCTLDGETGEITAIGIISPDPPLPYYRVGGMQSKNY
ncbi:MAG: hypothetical protein B6D58_02500 [candidate division Zixibacteria bacterium 4484_95]|nr:MAG: hypothetical protein B6D58_02500 [candidate division Zixibacteria bacterium 4484_95]